MVLAGVCGSRYLGDMALSPVEMTMTPEEHARVQKLEGLVKRYRRRITELKGWVSSLHEELSYRDVRDDGGLPEASFSAQKHDITLASVKALLRDAIDADAESGHEQRENWRLSHIDLIARWFGVGVTQNSNNDAKGVSFPEGVEK